MTCLFRPRNAEDMETAAENPAWRRSCECLGGGLGREGRTFTSRRVVWDGSASGSSTRGYCRHRAMYSSGLAGRIASTCGATAAPPPSRLTVSQPGLTTIQPPTRARAQSRGADTAVTRVWHCCDTGVRERLRARHA
jgi:hypothetical protein